MRRSSQAAWSTLAFLSLCLVGQAQEAVQVWDNLFSPSGWPHVSTSYVEAVPTGGIVTGSTASGGPQASSAGEAAIRHLTENGDLLWEVSIALPPEDYIGFGYRHYLADMAVGELGEVAVAVGSTGPMRVNMYEPDGSLRWTSTFPVVVGPHFDINSTHIEVAPNGDVVVCASEGLFANQDPRHFVLYRLSAPDGSLLWSVDAPSRDWARMKVDSLGNALLTVNRNATGTRVWQIDRFNPAGALTGSVQTTTSSPSSRLLNMEIDTSDRVVISLTDSPSDFLTSFNSSLVREWVTLIPGGYHVLVMMADGHVLLRAGGNQGRLMRFDELGSLVHNTGPGLSSGYHYGQSAGLPNRNSVATLRSFTPMCPQYMEERDPTGALVRTVDLDLSCGLAYTVTSDWRGNAYLGFSSPDAANGSPAGGATKFIFQDEEGTLYCGPAVRNSTGRGADIRAFGTTVAGDNNLSLFFYDLPVGSTLLPITSQTTDLVAMAGGGQGTLCLGGSVGRFDEPGEVRTADSSGFAALQLELLRVPTPTGLIPAMAGETWHFQAWYRDANPFPTSNFTDAVSVTLQ